MMRILLILSLLLLSGCGALKPVATPTIHTYRLEDVTVAKVGKLHHRVIYISKPTISSVYPGQNIYYLDRNYELKHFMLSAWTASPARMLHQILLNAFSDSGSFQGVSGQIFDVQADWRVNTEIVTFEQDFRHQPNQMHVTLRVGVIDLQAKKLLATRVFKAKINTKESTAYGGVVATNQALQSLIPQIVHYVSQIKA